MVSASERGPSFQYTVFLGAISCDTPARCSMARFQYQAAYQACPWYVWPGDRLPASGKRGIYFKHSEKELGTWGICSLKGRQFSLQELSARYLSPFSKVPSSCPLADGSACYAFYRLAVYTPSVGSWTTRWSIACRTRTCWIITAANLQGKLAASR